MGCVARKALLLKSGSIFFHAGGGHEWLKIIAVSATRAFRGLSGDPSEKRVHKVVEGGAGTNHRFRIANHHVLDTLLNHIWRPSGGRGASW